MVNLKVMMVRSLYLLLSILTLNTIMGSFNSKVECIWLPGQSGKTRTMMERIRDLEVLAKESCGGSLNIIISSNNRSLVDQTEVRMNKELYVDDEEAEQADAKIEGECFKWRSGLKNNNVTVGELADNIKEGYITMVVCCAHAKRLGYLYDLILNLNKSRNFKKRINIWIDEADASINLWSKDAFSIVTDLEKVNKITLVSATYDSVLKKFGTIRVLPCLTTMPPVYHRIQDCNIYEKNFLATDAPGYLKEVISRYSAEFVKPGVRLFAPGDVDRASHNSIAEYLLSLGFAVVVINGDRKEVIVPGRATPFQLAPYIDVETGDPEEIGRVIAKIYETNNLCEFPFAITGHLCLGRGITFQNDKFMFTHGVLFTMTDKANAYQTACRLAGNIKGYPDYSPPHLYTTSKMLETILQKENTAIHIARHVAENGLTEVDKAMVDYLYGDGKKPIREEDFLEDWLSFKSFEDAQKVAPRIQKKGQDDRGFWLCTYDTTHPTKLTTADLRRMKAGKKTANMPTINMKEVGAVAYRLYVIYSDPEDVNSGTYWLHELTRINVSDF
jgi:hypothetical protein